MAAAPPAHVPNPMIADGAGAARVFPVAQPVAMFRDYKRFLTVTASNHSELKLIHFLGYAHVWGYTDKALREDKEQNHGLAIGTYVTTNAGGGAANQETWCEIGITADADPYPAQSVDPLITMDVYQALVNMVTPSILFWAELITAHQVKRITAGNINGQAASFGMNVAATNPGLYLLPHLDFISACFGPLVGDMLAQIANHKWLGYHTQRASTHALLTKMVADIGGIAANIFTGGTLAAIAAAHAAPWDMGLQGAIPVYAVQMVACYLKGVNQWPSNRWYQGDNALASMAPNKREEIIAFWQKWVQFVSNKPAIDAANNNAAVNALVGIVFAAPG